jgi:fatty-acyl-CoA synthase
VLIDRSGKAPPIRFSDALKNRAAFKAPEYSDTDILAIAYTSGTTGLPKGAILTHASVDAMCSGLSAGLGWTFNERILSVAPLAFTGGFICKIAPVIKLGCCVRVEPSFDPARALRLIEAERITDFGGVPALWQRLAESPGFEAADISSLKNGTTGGAPVPKPLLETFLKRGVLIRQQYGCTEACGGATIPTARGAVEHPTSCGFAMYSLDVQIQDEAGAPAPEGVVGEICIKGPQVMAGYWNQPELTKSAFNGAWYRTGDLGRMDEHGVSVVDRKKNMVISGGVNIYPAEVERALSTVPGVAEIVVFGIPSPVWGEELVAIVHPQASFKLDAFRAEARERLGRMKTPKQFVISETPLPRTVTNKVARTNLAALFVELSVKEAV